MINLRNLVVLTASLIALTACAKTAAPDTAADEAAIKAIETAWDKAFTGGDGAAVAALYAEDAVLNAPGAPAARGKAAISDKLAKDATEFAAAGLTDANGPTTEVGISGDLAWAWGTYTVSDKSGATVETGKYITVFQRKDGKWMIIRDTWNSDAASATAVAAPASEGAAK